MACFTTAVTRLIVKRSPSTASDHTAHLPSALIAGAIFPLPNLFVDVVLVHGGRGSTWSELILMVDEWGTYKGWLMSTGALDVKQTDECL
eukprot:scaffold256158_cov21-Tisochrysis_lutea.AAC.1